MAREERLSKIPYKLVILLLKITPVVAAVCYALNSVLSYYRIDLVWFGYFAHLSFLSLLFLYLSSYVFRFCGYHRMFLHYIVVNEALNTYDYYIGIPITDRGFLLLHVVLIWLTLFAVLWSYLKYRKRNIV